MYYVRSASELTYKNGVYADTDCKFFVTDFDDLTTEVISFKDIRKVYESVPDKFINFRAAESVCITNLLYFGVSVRDNIVVSDTKGCTLNGVHYYLHSDSMDSVIVSRDKVFNCPMSRFTLRGWHNCIFTVPKFVCLLGHHDKSKSRILTLFNKDCEYIMTYIVRMGKSQDVEFIPLDNEKMGIRLRLTGTLKYFIPYL